MPKLIDLTGQKIGYLTVIKRLKNHGKKAFWLCECDCGKQIEMSGETLRKNKSNQSCGCKKIKDLTQKKFGRLTALYPTDKRDNSRNVIWHCQCDCGNRIDVSSHRLQDGNTKSCGCLDKETRIAIGKNNKKDLTGQIFNFIEVLEDDGTRKNNNVMWKCRCNNCGNIFYRNGSAIKKNMSCGCITSKGEQKIAQILTQNNISFESQKTFNTCYFEDTRRPAFFDFYLPDYNLLIEYDGEQHFFYKNEGWNTETYFKKTQIRDNIKNKWCKENNIKLIRIPYTKYKEITLNLILGIPAEIKE